MPDTLSPYWQGFYATQKRKTLKDCPYPQGSTEWVSWREGWHEASGCVDDMDEMPKGPVKVRSAATAPRP